MVGWHPPFFFGGHFFISLNSPSIFGSLIFIRLVIGRGLLG